MLSRYYNEVSTPLSLTVTLSGVEGCITRNILK